MHLARALLQPSAAAGVRVGQAVILTPTKSLLGHGQALVTDARCLLPAWTRARRALGALGARSARVGLASDHHLTGCPDAQALALAEAALCAAEDARVAAAAFARDAADAAAAAAAAALLLPSAGAAVLGSAGPAEEPRCARWALRTAALLHACCSARLRTCGRRVPAVLSSGAASASMRDRTGPGVVRALV